VVWFWLTLASTHAPALPKSLTHAPDPAQQKAVEEIQAWLRAPRRKTKPEDGLKYLAGPAGSGKTTIAREAVAGFRARFVAPTGKAALVLRSKGCADATTVHSLIYRPHESMDSKGNRAVTFSKNRNSALDTYDCDVVVADECSMLSAELANDLLEFGVRVLVLGDPYQLPPVEGKSPFATKKPDWLLDTIHRQAAESGVLALATDIRLGRPLGTDYGPDVVLASRDQVDPAWVFAEYEQVLCGTHRTRKGLNRYLRDAVGVSNKLPVAGDKVVCRRNNAEKGLINGGQWVVVRASYGGFPKWVDLVLESSDEVESRIVQTTVHPHHFLATYEDGALDEDALRKLPWNAAKAHQEFDYAYARTTHSAQGSEWSSVAVVDESGCFRDDASKWLYTAITRAKRKVIVLR
jgi:exodeoxyribonuclease-5